MWFRDMDDLTMQNVDSSSFPETELSTSKDKKASKSWNHEIRRVRRKIGRLIKSIRSVEEHVANLKNRLKKGKRSSSLQPDSQQRVDKDAPVHDVLTSDQTPEPSLKVWTEIGRMTSTCSSDEGPSSFSVQQQLAATSSNPGLQNETQTMTSASASHGAPVSPVFGTAPPEHAICIPAKLSSIQPNCGQMRNDSLAATNNVNFPCTAFAKPQAPVKRKRSDLSPARNGKRPTQFLVSRAFEKLQDACCDLMPTVRKLEGPDAVLSDEERAVVADFSTNQSLAELFLRQILLRIKKERSEIRLDLLQSLCRVYVALCKDTNDSHKAHALAYRLLKEDYPEAPKLLLFMVTVWPNVWVHDSPLCDAIQIVSRQKAEGEVLNLLHRFLHWDERPPGDIETTIARILKALVNDSSLKFMKNNWYGEDLCQTGWEYVFSLDLLCAQLDWAWTYYNIVGMELWPMLNIWLNQPRAQQVPIRDVCVAVVFRLLGRLGQLGLKTNQPMLVHNIAEGINAFGKHGVSEGRPWEVQLALVYTTHDLAPSNPREALRALTSWERKAMHPVPPAVTSCIRQIGSLMS